MLRRSPTKFALPEAVTPNTAGLWGDGVTERVVWRIVKEYAKKRGVRGSLLMTFAADA